MKIFTLAVVALFLPQFMVNAAKPDAVKARIKQENRSKVLSNAQAAWQAEQQKPSGVKKASMCQIAAEFGVPQQTLSDHINGKHRNQLEAAESRQKLNPQQEDALVELIVQLDKGAMPARRSDIEGYANAILNRGHRGATKAVGKSWIDGFFVRHREEIGTRWTSPLDKARADGLNPTTIKQHFQCVKNTQDKYGILPELDYGFDETPMMLGVGAKQRVVGRKKSSKGKHVKQSYAKRDGNRETLTVAETICADGTLEVPPMTIYQGKNFQKGWGGKDANPVGAL